MAKLKDLLYSNSYGIKIGHKDWPKEDFFLVHGQMTNSHNKQFIIFEDEEGYLEAWDHQNEETYGDWNEDGWELWQDPKTIKYYNVYQGRVTFTLPSAQSIPLPPNVYANTIVKTDPIFKRAGSSAIMEFNTDQKFDTCCSQTSNKAKYINFFNKTVNYCKKCGNEIK